MDINRECGQFKVQLTETEATISDKNNEAFCFCYYMGGYEHGLLSFLLNKDDDESKKALEMLVYLIASTQLIFSSVDFKQKFLALLTNHVEAKQKLIAEDENEPEDEIISQLKKEIDNKNNTLEEE